ncbi:hypothetical protein D1646_18435 [Pseudoflavonifractor sp. 60]|uniref:DUF6809 family protein n=1 Tax=Pseudoflavonifractor sp. 60 TaxID=2304576 RepID=UPI0013685A2B|nr:DUF6809 family protein [Pseudoflavonifractor sp. 60]NBI68722.1 hypothetical protein [Pseudoflavonifractor sp. 60]
MDDLMTYLYSFVLETRMDRVREDREYQTVLQAILQQEDAVRKNMDQEQRRALNRLLSEISSQNAIENEYIFRATLKLAQELRALV